MDSGRAQEGPESLPVNQSFLLPVVRRGRRRNDKVPIFFAVSSQQKEEIVKVFTEIQEEVRERERVPSWSFMSRFLLCDRDG